MSRTVFSAYLDLVRFTAAVLVLLEHGVLLGLLPRVPVVSTLSHESVVVFFVLSGFVIAVSSRRPGTTARDYAAARAARVCSVSVPALAVCYIAAALTSGTSAASLLSSALFLDGVWFNYGSVPFNGPYWSLCYEVWYYVCWGVLLFVDSPRRRLVLTLALLVAMGPALAVLAGIWLMGALLAIYGDRVTAALDRLARPILVAMLVSSVLAVLYVSAGPLEENVREALRHHVYGWWRLRGSEYLVTDYLIGALVTVHLSAALALFGRRTADGSIAARAVRYCAGFTFTLYLFHYPILLVLSRLRGPSTPTAPSAAAAVAVTLGAVWLIAFATERQLGRWRVAFSRAIDVCSTASRAFRRGAAHRAAGFSL